MVFVQRDQSQIVVGVYANPQPGYAEEALAADHADVQAWRNRKPLLLDCCTALCAEKLAAGFAFDFGDGRGVHLFGTAEKDLKGWDEVEKIFAVAARMGDAGKTVTIATDTAVAVVDLDDWNAIMLAAEAFRQPIWAASFAIQAKIAAGLITTPAGVAGAADWPA
jgi:hypothetical protein